MNKDKDQKERETPEEKAEAVSGEEEEVRAAEAFQEESSKEEEPPKGSDLSGEDSLDENTDKKESKTKEDKKDPKDVQIEELQDRLKRQMAEFDNFRKRTEKEKSAMYEVGAKDIIEKILPVLDNFERGLAAVPEDLKGGSFAEGVEMIYKQFIKTLEDAGVEAIEAVGQQFNPDLHNAVLHIDDEAYGENEISQELQKGYKYRGTVVRHSMVQVAN